MPCGLTKLKSIKLTKLTSIKHKEKKSVLFDDLHHIFVVEWVFLAHLLGLMFDRGSPDQGTARNKRQHCHSAEHTGVMIG